MLASFRMGFSHRFGPACSTDSRGSRAVRFLATARALWNNAAVRTTPTVIPSREDKPVSQQPKVKGIADIVFLLDATGSMGPCINAVKQNVTNFVTTMTTPNPNGGAVVKDW